MRLRALLPAVLAALLLLLAVSADWVLDFATPFLAALLLAVIIDPVVDALEARGMGRGPAALLVILSAGLCIVGLIWTMTANILREFDLLRRQLPEYAERSRQAVEGWVVLLERVFSGLPHPLDDVLDQGIDRLLDEVGEIGSLLVIRAGGLPGSVAVLLVVLVTAYFLIRDKRSLGEFFFQLVPTRLHGELRRLKGEIVNGLLGFVRAQCILVALSGALSVAGFWAFGYRYAWLLGISAGILDLVPMVGPSGVFIPLIAWGIAVGDLTRTFGIACVWAIVLIVRQFVEPEVVGRHVGLHPLTSIVAVYFGGKLLGINGILLGPIVAVTIKAVCVISVLPYLRQE